MRATGEKIIYKANYVIRPTQMILLPANKIVNRNVTQNYINNMNRNCELHVLLLKPISKTNPKMKKKSICFEIRERHCRNFGHFL